MCKRERIFSQNRLIRNNVGSFEVERENVSERVAFVAVAGNAVGLTGLIRQATELRHLASALKLNCAVMKISLGSLFTFYEPIKDPDVH